MGAQYGASDALRSDRVLPRAIPFCLNDYATVIAIFIGRRFAAKNGGGSAKRRTTFYKNQAAVLSYPSIGKAPMNDIEPTANTAPPNAVSKKVMSERIHSAGDPGHSWVSRSSLSG